MILTQQQAETVCAGMRLFNQVGGRLHIFMGNRQDGGDDRDVEVHEGRLSHRIIVSLNGGGRRHAHEEHDSQVHFAKFYGITDEGLLPF